MNYRRTLYTILTIVLCVFVISQCINKSDEEEQTVNKNGVLFAGSEACADCHKNIYDSHIETAHYLTTRPATEKYIKGSFDKGKNTYVYNNNLFIEMQKRDSGFYQVVYFKGEEKKVLPFDIIIGSGTKGQSFAYWQNNRLFQLPITYYEFAHQWANSPGFPNKVQFDRPITSRCLECHSTSVKTISAPGIEKEEFDRNTIIYGIDCEKCHGPGAKHVEYQTQHPNEKKGKYIINLALLSRQQNLDMCALCHGGNIQKIQPTFTFTAGDDLSKYFTTDSLSTAAVNFGTVDVHGNQYGLLQSSKCFSMSKMTCGSCHNTHENERGKTEVFSQRCITCHNNVHENFTTINKTAVTAIKNNCIDCHMPVKKSQSIVVSIPGSEVPTAALFRSHFISIYADESKKVLDSMKRSN